MYEIKICTSVCISHLIAETWFFLKNNLQASVMITSQNHVHILHIAQLFPHKASHRMHRCEKTSTLTPLTLTSF